MALAVIGPFEQDAFDGVLTQSLVSGPGPQPPASEPVAAHHVKARR
jgi:hypothetical protein